MTKTKEKKEDGAFAKGTEAVFVSPGDELSGKMEIVIGKPRDKEFAAKVDFGKNGVWLCKVEEIQRR